MTIIGIICVAGGSFFLGLIVASAIWIHLKKWEIKSGYVYSEGTIYKVVRFE